MCLIFIFIFVLLQQIACSPLFLHIAEQGEINAGQRCVGTSRICSVDTPLNPVDNHEFAESYLSDSKLTKRENAGLTQVTSSFGFYLTVLDSDGLTRYLDCGQYPCRLRRTDSTASVFTLQDGHLLLGAIQIGLASHLCVGGAKPISWTMSQDMTKLIPDSPLYMCDNDDTIYDSSWHGCSPIQYLNVIKSNPEPEPTTEPEPVVPTEPTTEPEPV
ncbi:uncharacterized protein J8A68_006038, partial [[Candida] subhashii]